MLLVTMWLKWSALRGKTPKLISTWLIKPFTLTFLEVYFSEYEVYVFQQKAPIL